MRSLFFVSPALILCLGSMLVLMMGLWISSNAVLLGVSLASLFGAAAVYLSMIGSPAQDAFAGLLVFDGFGLFFSLFAIGVGVLAFVMSAKSAEVKADRRSEYYSILLALISGIVFMGISNHLLMIYLAIETVSILSYTLAGFNRERSTSVEASMKYVVYGSMASAIMVFGMSLLFGVTGALGIDEIRQYMMTTGAADIPVMLYMAVIMIFAGFGYKISAAPMHMWTPDVYEGSPTPVSAFLSVAPKAAGFALITRFFVSGFTLPIDGSTEVVAAAAGAVSFYLIEGFNWPFLLMVSSVLTMFMGNLAALAQTSVKRLLAYSSIAHAGYLLMGLTTQTDSGLIAVLFYLMVYCLMNMGAFWVVSKVDDTMGGDHLRHFRGLVKTQPLYAALMAIFLVSLIGIPPFAGFLGKLYLFAAVIEREMYGFAMLAALNAVISLYYYAKVLKAMFLEEPELPMPTGKTAFCSRSAKVFLIALAVPNVLLIVYWEPLIQIATKSVSFFSGGSQ